MTPPGPKPAGDIDLVALDYEFAPDRLEVPVAVDLTFVVENRDDKTAHNIHFTTLAGNPKTKLQNGPIYQTLTVRFEEPGEYPFICDIHPTMVGFVVAN